jgi:hypothetical protein
MCDQIEVSNGFSNQKASEADGEEKAPEAPA